MNIKTLRSLFDAMHHGKYEFEDFLNGDVTKNYERILVKRKTAFRPNKKLRAYHTFLNKFVCEYLSINRRVVYSYIKGVNPHQAVVAHATSRAFYQTDIINFFGSLTRNLVSDTLINRGDRVPITDISSYIQRVLELTTIDGYLPVGFSTSPPLSNACLTGFDDELEAYCLRRNLIYTRYADDIVISAQSREQLNGIEIILQNILMRHFEDRLTLNTEKSKLTTVGRKIKILGMVILPSGQVAIDMELKSRIEVLLHFYVRDRERFLDTVQQDMKAGIRQLAGYVNYVNAVDKAYLEKLRRKFGSTVIDSFLHRSAT